MLGVVPVMVIKMNAFSTFREEIFETCGAGKVSKQDPATAWTRVESLGVVACSLVIIATYNIGIVVGTRR